MVNIFAAGLAGAARGLERVGEEEREIKRANAKYENQAKVKANIALETKKIEAADEATDNKLKAGWLWQSGKAVSQRTTLRG